MGFFLRRKMLESLVRFRNSLCENGQTKFIWNGDLSLTFYGFLCLVLAVFRIGISISFVHSSFLLRVAIRIIKVMRSSRIVISWVQIKAFEIASNGLSEMTKWTAARYFCFAFILHPTSCTPHITQNEMSRCRLMWASPNMIPFAALMIFVFPSKPLGSFTFRDQLHQRSTPLFRFDAY